MNSLIEVTVEAKRPDGTMVVLIRTLRPDNCNAELADMRRELNRMLDRVEEK